MGVWGWDEIDDGVKLEGFVAETPSVADDGDWCFMVAPARGFRKLLMNPSGNTNRSGLIECEVEPPEHLSQSGTDVGKDSVADQLLGSPKGKWVTITGTWSVDKSHSVFGDSITDLGGSSSLGKTEIHPITSVLVEHVPAADNSSRTIDFLVFSDDSANMPAHVPHSHEDRHGAMTVPIALGATFKIVSELDRAQSKGISTENSSRFQTLRFQIVSGKPENGKGFYHARVALPGFTLLTFLLSRGSDPSKGVREMMHRAQTTTLRGLFKRLDAGALPPLPCAALLSQIGSLQTALASVARQEKVLQKGGTKPKQDPAFEALQKTMKDLNEKLAPLIAQADALGCFG